MGHCYPDQFDRDAATYGLEAVIRKLGAQRRGDRARSRRWKLDYLTAMIAQAGFPRPIPILSGDALVEAVKPASQWPAAAVDRWLADRTPPGSDSAADIAARRQGESDMDDRAAAIGRQVAGAGGLTLIAGGAR